MTRLIFSFAITILTFCFSTIVSCNKEYSCEGCYVRDSIPPIDTTTIRDTTKIDSTLNFQLCNTCDSTKPLKINSWSIRNYNSYLCGDISFSRLNGDNHALSFWGYPNCTRDTGFSMAAWFYPLELTADHFNAPAAFFNFRLQDHTNYMNSWYGNILSMDATSAPPTMTVVVDTFINSTKLIVGRFYGYAYTKNNDKSYVDGKFKFIVK